MARKRDLKWFDAIIKILSEEQKALHYSDIAELIAERGYRIKLGKTPSNSVNTALNLHIKEEGKKSKIVKLNNKKGEYILRKVYEQEIVEPEENIVEAEKEVSSNIIKTIGMYWDRDLVIWKSPLNLYGVERIGAEQVNFGAQTGIYLLHDNREVLYVGQAVKQPIMKRLLDHTKDRLSGRWNRFSWFGFQALDKKGKLQSLSNLEVNTSISDIANTIEAVLIEALEPRQNRKGGNNFKGVEYLQLEDPKIRKNGLVNEFIKRMNEF